MIVTQPRADRTAPIATLGQILLISQSIRHQRVYDACHLAGAVRPRRAPRKTKTRQRWRNYGKGVLNIAPEAFRMRKRLDQRVEFGHRPRPAMRDHQRHRVWAASLLKDEMHVDPVDLRLVVCKTIDPGLLRAPVKAIDPIVAQLLEVV